ncbi:MAG: hypothetical protein HOK28_02085, partial [Deltaproteobacteria bacterium]|nr:hypothetical protein [Deltaproteobacteria bacterium]
VIDSDEQCEDGDLAGLTCASAGDYCSGDLACLACSIDASDCIIDGLDSDGDTLSDCEETEDGLPFTDPFAFNGLTAIIGESPGGFFTSGQCNVFFGGNYGAMWELFDNSNQTMDIHAGWGYAAGSTNDYDNPSHYDFEPNWSHSNNTGIWGSFQILFTGQFHADDTGLHCFSVDTGAGGIGPGDIAGRRNSCGRVYINANSTSIPLAETGYGSNASPNTGCVHLGEGAHDIDIAARHYESYSYSPLLRIRHCFGGGSTCSPNQPLPASSLQINP